MFSSVSSVITYYRCRDVQLQNRRRFQQPQEDSFVEGELVVHLSSDNNTAADEDEEGRLSRLRSPPPAAAGLHHNEQSQERGIIEICHSIKRSRNEAVNVGVGKLGNYICI